jgi:hypothetical protein
MRLRHHWAKLPVESNESLVRDFAAHDFRIVSAPSAVAPNGNVNDTNN